MKLQKKTILTGTGVLLLVAATASVIYFVNAPEPEPVSDKNKSIDISKMQRKDVVFDTEQPEGTLTPKQVLEDKDSHKDKEIIVRGLLFKSSEDDKIYVSDQTSDGAKAIAVDIGNTPNAAQYINGFSDNGSSTSITISNPVTITGTLKIEGAETITLIASDIKQ